MLNSKFQSKGKWMLRYIGYKCLRERVKETRESKWCSWGSNRAGNRWTRLSYLTQRYLTLILGWLIKVLQRISCLEIIMGMQATIDHKQSVKYSRIACSWSEKEARTAITIISYKVTINLLLTRWQRIKNWFRPSDLLKTPKSTIFCHPQPQLRRNSSRIARPQRPLLLVSISGSSQPF
jgi:hypothetical protein